MEIKGQAQFVLRDAETGEIISQYTQENIITESLYNKIYSYNQVVNSAIVVSSAPMESSRFTYFFPAGTTNSQYTSFPNTTVPANGNWYAYTAPTALTQGVIQFAGRYNAPTLGTSRTINSVGLGSINYFTSSPQTSFVAGSDNTSYLGTSGSTFEPIAFLKLATPCIQTDTQVLDVYYRLIFPYDSTGTEYNIAMFRQLVAVWAGSGSYSNSGVASPFKVPTRKSYDSDKTVLPWMYWVSSRFVCGWTPTLNNQSTPPGSKGFNYTDPNFTDQTGYIINGVIWSNAAGWPSSYTNLATTSKIGNLIGQGDLLTSKLAYPFLDVDNLPSGSGKIYLGGTYNNAGTPNAPGLYYTYKPSGRNIIKITTSGQVGTSTYKLIKQNSVGIRSNIQSNSYDSRNKYYAMLVPGLAGDIKYANYGGSAVNEVYDYSATLMGNVEDAFFAGQQISACERFDDSSIVVVKKDQILLYNIFAGDYWRFTGSFSDIGQIAIVNGKIYVGCRNTGLYVIDPYNSLTVTSLASPAAGIDLSQCYGAARGFNNMLWVVGANCLSSFDGTTWTKYDATTTPAFNMTGVSNGNWSNIEYLKVDEENSANQMLLVRKFNATVDPTLLGVWWSTVGVATNTGAEPISGLGRPRINKSHVNGRAGLWAVFASNRYRIMSFGTNTFTATAPAFNANRSYYYNFQPLLQSVIIVKNNNNEPRLLIHEYIDDSSTMANFAMYLVNSAGVATDTIDSTNYGSTFQRNDLVNGNSIGYYTFASRSTSLSSYGGQNDQTTCFELAPGLLLIAVNTQNQTTQYTGALVGGTFFMVMQYGLTAAPNGGSTAYLARQEYGWDGTQWVLGNSNSKPTHTVTDQLADGVTVRFENGSAGTSFITPNVYLYTISDGLYKDNATRSTYTSTLYYYRKLTKGATDLQSTTVPNSTALTTGIISPDLARASANVAVNLDNEVIFSGFNCRQYAVGDKEVTGDFVISLDITNINAANVKNAAVFGVTRVDFINGGMIQFGWIWSAGILYWYDNGSTGSVANPPSATSLLIRRTSGVLELVRNGTVVRTHNNAAIRPADYRLNTMFGVWDHRDTTYYNGGVRVPRATITSNGSDNGVYFGNSVTNTGAFADRFYGLDVWTTGASTILLDGVAATIKTDGTAPGPGQVTVDGFKGIMYFNSADQGKSISANYMYQST